MPVEIGRPAPEFTLRNHDRGEVSLSDLRGRKALVVFIPFPFTAVCDGEVCSIRDSVAELKDLDAGVVVITCDTVAAHGQWARERDLGFPILSDFWPHGATARAYGCFDERTGAARRATYVLDEDGIVRDVIATDRLRDPRDVDSYKEALEAL